ncbi:hypothetical protein E2C01_083662 [Portunus trituberculatus]|uniref:Uncharacterized protein n=1 Tax=Portunus trituberculatus TaxID=210409 RepID=A0A5B7J2R2_PORTR|nr:hypothetical protein [Portunus trituberculatus]
MLTRLASSEAAVVGCVIHIASLLLRSLPGALISSSYEVTKVYGSGARLLDLRLGRVVIRSAYRSQPWLIEGSCTVPP